MSGAAASSSSSAGFLPASLAALLSLPLDSATMRPPQLGTRSVGSFFSNNSPAPSSPGLAQTVHTSSASSPAPLSGIIAPLAFAPEATSSAVTAGLMPSAPQAGFTPAAPVASLYGAYSPPPPAGSNPVVPPAPPAPSPIAYAPPAGASTGSLPPPFHFGNLITVKLSSDNYIFWPAQVLPLLGSHYLLGYVNTALFLALPRWWTA
nr:branchpoint-bridging protein-like [Aegilops tauschii subsp. strangulata]